MAFTVEDGTGVIDANAYAEVEDADAYFLERGITGWTGTDDQKKTWIIQATDYIEMRFASRFKGTKEFPDTPQGLSFPRVDIEDRDGNAIEGIPLCLKRATYEYANRARVAALAPDPVYETSGRLLVGKRTKVGPIETDLKYAETGAGSAAPAFRPYPAADALLRPLVASAGGVYR